MIHYLFSRSWGSAVSSEALSKRSCQLLCSSIFCCCALSLLNPERRADQSRMYGAQANEGCNGYECAMLCYLRLKPKMATGLTRILAAIRRKDSHPDDIPFTAIGRMPSRQRSRECVVVSSRLSWKTAPVTLTSISIQYRTADQRAGRRNH